MYLKYLEPGSMEVCVTGATVHTPRLSSKTYVAFKWVVSLGQPSPIYLIRVYRCHNGEVSSKREQWNRTPCVES